MVTYDSLLGNPILYGYNTKSFLCIENRYGFFRMPQNLGNQKKDW